MLKHQIFKGVLFIIFAVPGALLSVFSGIFLIASFSIPEDKMPFSVTVLSLLYLAGAALTIVGLGKIKQWLYGLVFLTMPLTFWLFALVDSLAHLGMLPFLGFVGGSAFLTYRLVDKFYADRTAPQD